MTIRNLLCRLLGHRFKAMGDGQAIRRGGAMAIFYRAKCVRCHHEEDRCLSISRPEVSP